MEGQSGLGLATLMEYLGDPLEVNFLLSCGLVSLNVLILLLLIFLFHYVRVRGNLPIYWFAPF